MNEIKKALKPVRQKIIIEKSAHWILLVLSMGLFACAGLVLYSKWNFINNVELKAVVILILCILSICILVFKSVPDYLEVAKIADALGYKQRFTTFFESEETVGKGYHLLTKDLQQIIRTERLDENFKYTINKKLVSLFFGSIFLLMAVFFVPSPYKAEFDEIRILKAEELKNLEQFTESNKELIDALDKDSRAEIEKIVIELKKGIQSAKNEEELKNADALFQENLMRQTAVSKDLKEIAEKLQQNDKMKPLGNSIKQADKQEISERIEQLSDEIGQMGEEELQSLGEFLASTSGSMDTANVYSDLLNQLSQSILEGNIDNIQQILSEIENIAVNEATEKDRMKQIADAYRQNNENSQSKGINIGNSTGEFNQGSQQGKSSQEQAMQGGQGNAQGLENGSGTGRGEGHVENSPDYSSQNMNKDFQIFSAKGQFNDSGSYLSQEVQTMGTAGEYISYGEVFSEYSEEALSALDKEELPEGMKDIIREYFSSLD